MKPSNWMLYAGFIVVAALIYFGTSVISSKQQTIEKSRVLVKQSKSIQVLLREAHHSVKPQERVQIDELGVLIERASSDQERIGYLEQLAGMWYSLGHYAVSGHYASKIAEIRKDASSWSIVGTTYAQGISAAKEERDKKYCAEQARGAFDQAKLLDPSNKDVDLNKALTYISLPDEGNPMAGIQMMLKLKNQYPDYAPVYRHLGRLGIQTGQFDKALERLRTAWALEQDQGKVSCLLSEVFNALGKADSAQYYNQLCKN